MLDSDEVRVQVGFVLGLEKVNIESGDVKVFSFFYYFLKKIYWKKYIRVDISRNFYFVVNVVEKYIFFNLVDNVYIKFFFICIMCDLGRRKATGWI